MKLKQFLAKNYSIIFVCLIALLILIKNALLVGFMHHSDHFGYHLFYGEGFIGLKLILELMFLAFIFSISLFFKKKGRYIYIFIMYMVIMILNVVDMVYCRCFQGAPGIFWIFMNRDRSTEGNSYFLDPSIYASWLDILFFIDIPFIIFMLIFGFKKDLFKYPKLNSPLLCTMSFLVLIAFSTINPKKTCASTNTENKVAAYTSLGYHIIDFKDSIEVGNKAKITDSVLNDFKSYQNLLIEDELSAKDNLNASGVLKDSNLIFIQMEAIESLCIGNTINGKEITPNLNKLLDNSYRFDLYDQIKNGSSSDCDLTMMTSQFPMNKAINFNYFPDSEYHSLAEELKLNGYNTLYINGSNHSEWGYRDVETTTMGFDRDIYDIPGDKKVVGYIADECVLDFAYDEIEKLKDSKFYTHIVLVSSHFPYPKDENNIYELGLKNMGAVGNYIELAHYVDKCIGEFVNKLENSGILDNSTLVITGDHGGIHRFMPNRANKQAKKYPFIGNSDDYTVPYIVYNKKLEKQKINVIGGQIDALPTLAYMYDLKFNYKDGRIFMGRNLLKTNLNYAYLNNGKLKGTLTKEEKKILSKGYDISDILIRGYYYNED